MSLERGIAFAYEGRDYKKGEKMSRKLIGLEDQLRVLYLQWEQVS